MDNVRLEGIEDQYVLFTSVENLGRNVYVSCSKRIRKFPQQYDTGFGDDG